MPSKLKNLVAHLKSLGIPLSYSLMKSTATPKLDLGPGRLQAGILGAMTARNLSQEWFNSFTISQDDFYPLNGGDLAPQIQDPLSELCDSSRQHTDDNHSPMWLDFSTLNSAGRVNALRHDTHHGLTAMLPDNSSYGIAQSCDADGSLMKDNVLRSSRLRVISAQHFTAKNRHQEAMAYFSKQRLLWWKRMLNLPANLSLSTPSLPDADPVLSVGEIRSSFPWGSMVVETLSAFATPGQEEQKCCIEMISTMEHALLLLFYDAFHEHTTSSPVVMKLYPKLAPFKAAIISTDGSSDDQSSLAMRLSRQLKVAGICCHLSRDITVEDAIRLHDGLGTPYVIVVDDRTVSRGVIAMRNRDNGISEHVHLQEVKDILRNLIEHR